MKEMLTIRELQKRLCISKVSAYSLVKSPGFPVCRAGKKILIPADKLQLWIDKGGSQNETEKNQ